jgi:hypothetical protein
MKLNLLKKRPNMTVYDHVSIEGMGSRHYKASYRLNCIEGQRIFEDRNEAIQFLENTAKQHGVELLDLFKK